MPLATALVNCIPVNDHPLCLGGADNLPYEWLGEPYTTELWTTGVTHVPRKWLYLHLDKSAWQNNPDELIKVEAPKLNEDILQQYLQAKEQERLNEKIAFL